MRLYHETTRSSLQQISTTRRSASQIPSTKRTRRNSPSGTGMGQTSQNSAVLRLKVRPAPGISSCVSFDRSHDRSSSKRAAVSSWRTVVDAPQAVHLHLCAPEEVLPFLFVGPPQ